MLQGIPSPVAFLRRTLSFNSLESQKPNGWIMKMTAEDLRDLVALLVPFFDGYLTLGLLFLPGALASGQLMFRLLSLLICGTLTARSIWFYRLEITQLQEEVCSHQEQYSKLEEELVLERDRQIESVSQIQTCFDEAVVNTAYWRHKYEDLNARKAAEVERHQDLVTEYQQKYDTSVKVVEALRRDRTNVTEERAAHMVVLLRTQSELAESQLEIATLRCRLEEVVRESIAESTRQREWRAGIEKKLETAESELGKANAQLIINDMNNHTKVVQVEKLRSEKEAAEAKIRELQTKFRSGKGVPAEKDISEVRMATLPPSSPRRSSTTGRNADIERSPDRVRAIKRASISTTSHPLMPSRRASVDSHAYPPPATPPLRPSPASSASSSPVMSRLDLPPLAWVRADKQLPSRPQTPSKS